MAKSVSESFFFYNTSMLSQSFTNRTAVSHSAQAEASAVLTQIEEGQPLRAPQALALLALKAPSDCARLRSVAELLKTTQVGPEIGYGIGQSLFLTNVCEMNPALYSYPTQSGSPLAYHLSIDDIDTVLQAAQAEQTPWLTISGGGFHSGLVIPGLEAPTVLKTYLRVLNYIQDQASFCRIRGFSPDEIAFLAVVSNRSEAYILDCLQDHGVRVLEGFGAEILDNAHRARISPKKLPVKRWLEIAAMAYERGMPSIARLEAGPVETWNQRLTHLVLLREFQETHPGAFQKLVIQWLPLPSARPIPEAPVSLVTDLDALKLVAVARLLLGACIPQIQFSWIPERLPLAQQTFEWGASHAGNTDDMVYAHFLRNQPQAPVWTESELRGLIQEAGQQPQLAV